MGFFNCSIYIVQHKFISPVYKAQIIIFYFAVQNEERAEDPLMYKVSYIFIFGFPGSKYSNNKTIIN